MPFRGLLCCAIYLLIFFSSGAAQGGWIIDSDGVGYVKNYDGNTDFAMADIVTTIDGTKQVIFRLKPLTERSCEPQGVRNGNSGFIVESKMFVNDTLIFTKKFIEPSGGGRCFIYYAGQSKLDKKFIVDAFLEGDRVIIEVDGAEKNIATKYRGEQLVMSGAARLDGGPITIQSVVDSRGERHNFATVQSDTVRWAIFSTQGFRKLWYGN